MNLREQFGFGARMISISEDYKHVFNSETGERVFADLMEQLCSDYYANPRTDNPEVLYELNAMHKIAAYIRTQLTMTESDYKRIMDVHQEREQSWPTNLPPQ